MAFCTFNTAESLRLETRFCREQFAWGLLCYIQSGYIGVFVHNTLLGTAYSMLLFNRRNVGESVQDTRRHQ